MPLVHMPLFRPPWPWPWSYLFGGPSQFGAVIFGLLLAAIGLLYLVYGLLGGDRGPLRVIARLVPFSLANGLASALVVGLALGLVGGIAFGLTPWHVGRYLLPDNWQTGAAMGLGCGILFGCAPHRATRLPLGLVLGAAAGLVIGLAVFRLVFGVTAAFGYETDAGVGTEVGLVFGMVGALAGALAGTLIGRRQPPATSPDSAAAATTPARPRHPLALGLVAGAAVALAIGVVGWLTGAFMLMLPYYGGFTDCPGPPACGQPLSPSLAQTLGVVYGLGLFALGGALVGGLAGALARKAPAAGPASPHWAGVAAGLVAGLASALATGLQHRYVGGPAIIPSPVVDPMAGGIGLAVGLVAGQWVGLVCALLLARAEAQPGRRAILFGAVLLLLGLVAWTMSSWFTPLIAIDIP